MGTRVRTLGLCSKHAQSGGMIVCFVCLSGGGGGGGGERWELWG